MKTTVLQLRKTGLFVMQQHYVPANLGQWWVNRRSTNKFRLKVGLRLLIKLMYKILKTYRTLTYSYFKGPVKS